MWYDAIIKDAHAGRKTVVFQISEKFARIMKKRLSEMSLEELWRLFPIFLTSHQAQWDIWYAEEAELLHNALAGEPVIRISHIGSTAVAGIWAKPIIDMLVEISLDSNLEDLKDILIDTGYRCMSENEKRVSYNKGYTENGFEERVFHLHARYVGDNDELYFRDYLRAHPSVAWQYESLKLSLWKTYEHDRDAYTEHKTGFIAGCTRLAREEYGDRYRDAGTWGNSPATCVR